MEPKKNPKYDVHRKRGLIFNVSLIVSLLVVIAAFRWTAPRTKRPDNSNNKNEYDYALHYVPVIYHKPSETPVPKPLKKPMTSAPVSIEVRNDPSKPLDEGATDIPPLAIGVPDVPPEIISDTITFRIVENMPEPVGGWQGFYNALRKNMKYPKQAQRTGTTGKVFIEFTVNEQGALENIRILKGIGYGCDEEAKRVLALTKWNAGKQRGRPVKVRMAQQISFFLTQ